VLARILMISFDWLLLSLIVGLLLGRVISTSRKEPEADFIPFQRPIGRRRSRGAGRVADARSSACALRLPCGRAIHFQSLARERTQRDGAEIP
jgi:hypothetical protein